MLAITLVGDWPSPLGEAAQRVLAALQETLGKRLPTGSVNIKLVDDTEIATLNRQYTGNAYATDVLTFNYSEDSAEHGPISDSELADMVISTETAARQAKAAASSLADEVGLLVLHGLLHVLGYDHQTDEARAEVDRLQRRVLDLAGITYREFQWES